LNLAIGRPIDDAGLKELAGLKTFRRCISALRM